MRITKKTRLEYRLNHFIFIFLLLACIGFSAWLSNEYDSSSDWTAGKRHSLSSDTIELLTLLPQAINLRTYQADKPALKQAINEILKRYQTHAENFSFEIINPDIFIKQAKADNIQQLGQTIIEYQGRTERLDNLSEESISNALLRLQRHNPSVCLFLTQHGERSIDDTSADGYSLFASRLSQQGFQVRHINLVKDRVPETNSLLILGSIKRALLPKEAEKIQHYIDNGGNILWLQDPKIDRSQYFISKALNIEFSKGIVVDNNPEISRMLKLSHPAIIAILEYKVHPITAKMQYFTLFTTAAAVHSIQNKDWISSDLLISSASSWSETTDFSQQIKFDITSDIAGPLTIGIAKQRQVKSSTDLTSQRAVIIGDSNFISNNNIGQGANLEFMLNSINWLTKNEKLISITPKNAPDLQLNLSATSAAIMGIIFLVALPLIFFISGAAIWIKRKRQ